MQNHYWVDLRPAQFIYGLVFGVFLRQCLQLLLLNLLTLRSNLHSSLAPTAVELGTVWTLNSMEDAKKRRKLSRTYPFHLRMAWSLVSFFANFSNFFSWIFGLFGATCIHLWHRQTLNFEKYEHWTAWKMRENAENYLGPTHFISSWPGVWRLSSPMSPTSAPESSDSSEQPAFIFGTESHWNMNTMNIMNIEQHGRCEKMQKII